jgi:signal transduction histidine kinase
MYDIPEKGVIRHLDKINDITEKTAKLTQQLLGFARKGKYMRKNIELNELVRQSAELFMPKSQEDMNVEIGVADVEMWVKGDPLQLQQVILNLLINARDAIEDNKGGFKYIALKTGFASELELKLTPPLSDKDFEGVYYYISVEDSGPGIPESDRSRIFEPFFTTKPFGKGTGMGLAMVYGTITNHNGWVQLETETGRGASFYIFLPMA